MTNKIAIEYLKDMLASAEANLHVPDMAEHAEALNMAIESLSAQQKLKWIPCSERLPEEYGEYFVTWMTSLSKRLFVAICEGEVTSEYDHEYNRFKFEWLLDDYIKAYPDVEVIAWMPLPEPYKKGNTDD